MTIHRSKFILFIVFFSLFLCGSLMAVENKKPNVLFIAIDDLNDWVGCLGGHSQAKTPHIDRLAARGQLFTKAYCPSPSCNPSRVAIMLGRRPSTTGVYNNSQHDWRDLHPKAVTIAQHFKNNGYHVAGGGKIFHGAYKGAEWKGTQDPESWHEFRTKEADALPDKTLPFPLKGTAPNNSWSILPVEDTEMDDHKQADWTIEFLKKSHEKPFFLATGIFRPHKPWNTPKKYYDLYPLDTLKLPEVPEDDLEDVPVAGRNMTKKESDHDGVVKSGHWKRLVQAYLAGVSFADAQVGRIIEALDSSPHRDNTIVVLWSDHGYHLGEKHHWTKFTLWERANRVPLIFKVPGVKPSVCDQSVDLLSLYPTLAELCALPEISELEGPSIRPLIENPTLDWTHAAVMTHGFQNHAVRKGPWRYIRYADGSEELYNHDADPNEWTNLASDSKYESNKKELAEFLPRVNVPEPERPKKAAHKN
jgi:arylsulfatase A-like enzyme